ncbi:MAG TPA: hypothetical protein DCL54_10470 [Alphaproteobacteria bacterium]|nr:hypothetical protein [Alphaproteobacteria bacterium]HAJ46991.1 hypothetical protein [Alphaproteobacteria bacterium]
MLASLNVMPLLLIPLALYNFVVFTGLMGTRVITPETSLCVMSPSSERIKYTETQSGDAVKMDGCVVSVDQGLHETIFTIGMFSGDAWNVSFADLFLALSLLLLFVEIVKSTRTDSTSIINHGLSMLVAVVCIIQFVTNQGFSNSVFFLLMLMTLLDVVAGFTVTIVAAKRDFGSSSGVAGTH